MAFSTFFGFAGGLVVVWFIASWKLTSSIEKNIQEARKEREEETVKILVEEFNSITKEAHEEIPNEIKRLMTKYYKNIFVRTLNLPNGLSKSERNKDKLKYALISMLTSIIVFLVGGILSYLGIAQAVLLASILGGVFLIFSLLLFLSVITEIKWT